MSDARSCIVQGDSPINNDMLAQLLLLTVAAFLGPSRVLAAETIRMHEHQITDRPGGHLLTNVQVWSPDGQWIVYDTRSDPIGAEFDGRTIEIVNVESHEVREVFRSQNGAYCGVATFSPIDSKVVCISGPEHPTADWQYSPCHRRGVIVNVERPGQAIPLEARDVSPPFTPGALRGGSHVHVYSGDGEWVSYTYEDHVLAALDAAGVPECERDLNQRNIGVSVLTKPVRVPKSHSRNCDGAAFSVVVTRTVNRPRPGSDEISRAFEDAWVGTDGYTRRDGTHQRRAIAFQGHVVTSAGATIAEAFVVDIPEDVTIAGEDRLEGTSTTMPRPPRGTRQRRLTFTAGRKYPGLQGPRHWLRSSPDGSRIAILMRDDAGVVQLWTVSPLGGELRQITRHPFNIASAFTWSPCGEWIAYIADNSVFITNAAGGSSVRLTPRSDDAHAPRSEACVFAPDGRHIAFVRPVEHGRNVWNQIFVMPLE